MAAFGADGRCLMRALREELDDPDPQDCGICAVCTAPQYDGPLDAALVREAALHLRSRPLLLDVKKMAPDPEGKMRKLGDDVRAEEGRALARLGDGGWDPLIQSGRREGRFADELVEAAAEAVRSWRAPVALGHRGPEPPQRRTGPRLRAAAGGGARPAVPPGARARRRQPAAARDDELRPAGRQRARRVRGDRRPAAGARACSSTTSASAAGRWR